MAEIRPKNIVEYKRWLSAKGNSPFSFSESHYREVSTALFETFSKSEFWDRFQANILEYKDDYSILTGYPLISGSPTSFELKIKPYDSFIEKTYRKNIINNQNWDNPPGGGDWVFPDKWYTRVGDVVRTLIPVKYMDGVIFLKGKISELCEEIRVPISSIMEKRMDGHYAAHIYIDNACEIPSSTIGTMKINSKVEIQITTQLHEVIKDLLHKYYEISRSKPHKENEEWQWDYLSEEFSANYLGHILQYIDGKIVEIREKQHKEEKER